MVPPAELLNQVQPEGVEKTLRRGRRLGRLGWGAFVVSAASALLTVFTSDWWKHLRHAEWDKVVENWIVAVPVGVLVVAFVLINWTRIWVNASRTPFRYTYSIEDFGPVEGTSSERRLAWLRHDLATRLSQRVGRLSLLDERYSGTTTFPESHIHIGGSYGVRRASDGTFAIEVMPWVRLGPTGSAATLAHPVRFTLNRGEHELSTQEGPVSYEKLVERVYFSIATHVYAQIRKDVQHKIDLLPRRYFRAAAYFYEAEDYLRSNTLDAYDQARELYYQVIRLYYPGWGESEWAHSTAGRLLQSVDRALAWWSLAWRRVAAHLWPGLGRVELMLARAEVGYARTLVYRRALAGFSGQRLNPIFEARPMARRAYRRLHKLSKDVPGRRKRIFDALVTEAAALSALGSDVDANERLEEARRLDPARAEQNAACLYAMGQVETRQRAHYFQRAVELAPFFEVAQFERAMEAELVWRRRPTLEENVAEIVAGEYDRVLRLNPGNIAAWANLGYMHWLLEKPDRARQALERGREYKEIKRETFVAELDYSLARIAAEAGDFERAYRHYIDAVSAHLAQGVSHSTSGYTGYQFESVTTDIIERFRRYRRRVKKHWRDARDGGGPASDMTTQRVRDAVYSFVLNDYGEACLNYWLRSGDSRYRNVARRAFEHSLLGLRTASRYRSRPQTRFPLISYNLNRLQWLEISAIDASQLDEGGVVEAAEKLLSIGPGDTYIDRALTYEPNWPDGLIEKATSDMEYSRQCHLLAPRLEAFADARREKAKELGAETGRATFPAGGNATELDEQYLVKLATGSETFAAATPDEDRVGRVERRRAEARDHLEKARGIRDLAGKLREAARVFEKEARDVPPKLLPHGWLWRTQGRPDWSALKQHDLRSLWTRKRSFNWGAATSHDLKKERRWERELDDLHARALFTLCSLELSGLVKGEEADQVKERVRPVLNLLRERFWPDDFAILTLSGELSEGEPESVARYNRQLRALVTRWCERDPAFWALSWVDEKLFPGDDKAQAIELLHTMRGDRGVPASLYGWIGDRLYAWGDKEGARDAYEGNRGRLKPAVRRGIARTHWALGSHAEALAELGGIRGGVSELGAEWRTRLIDELDVDDPQSYRLLKNWLGKELTTSQLHAFERGNGSSAADVEDAASAVLLLARTCYHQLVRRPAESGLEVGAPPLFPVTPAILEAEEGFFPEGAETKEVVRMIEREIPRFREETALGRGLQLAPIHISASNEIMPSSYRLHFEGIVRAQGRFALGETRYVPDGPRASKSGLAGSPGRSPLVGTAGLWLDEATQVPDGMEVWDRHSYMLQQLRVVMLQHADGLLLAPQAVEAYREVVQRPLDAKTGVRLAQVLRGLAKEDVRITDLREVVAAFANAGGATGRDLLEHVRFALRGGLCGADGSRRLCALRPDLEDRIAGFLRTNGGDHFLAALVADATALRNDVEDLISRVDPDTSALVVLTPYLRPFVRGLVAPRHPALPILAYAELPEGSMPSIRCLEPIVAGS